MKIVNLHTRINIDELLSHLQQKLNPMFKERRKCDITFKIEKSGDIIEISQPELYEGFLFRIRVKDTELLITRSEHYVDDVNSLTIESILYELFNDLSDKQGAELVLEG
jgi:hypothetical protein